jgi:hypothetical protein
MRKAILKDGHHVIDGNDDLNDLGFIHGDADQFDFQEFDQHSQGDHHPVIEHPHIDYTILDLYDNNGHWGLALGINNLGEIATEFNVFNKDGHVIFDGSVGGVASLDNAGDVVRWDASDPTLYRYPQVVTYADGTSTGPIGPQQSEIGPAGEPVYATQTIHMNVNHEFAGWYVVGTSDGGIAPGVPERGFIQFGDNGPAQDFMVPGSTRTYISGLNDHGDLAGGYQDSAGWHGFVDQSGRITTLDLPPSLVVDGHETPVLWSISGLNNLDQVVGTVLPAGTATLTGSGFVYDHGKISIIDGPISAPNSWTGTVLTGINDHGDVVGYQIPNPNVAAYANFEFNIDQLQQATAPSQQEQVSEGPSIYHQIVDHSNHS